MTPFPVPGRAPEGPLHLLIDSNSIKAEGEGEWQGLPDDVLAYMEFPREHWAQIASTNPLERVNREIKRRSDVIGISLAVADGVQLRIHAAFGSANQTPTPPFLTPRLDAVRWAFRCVASIITVVSSPCSAASPAMMRAKTPLSLHRFQRL